MAVLKIKTLAPLSHGAFSDASTGNMSAFRREPIVSLPGYPRVPVVSGNAIRGLLRRTLMRHAYASCGVDLQAFLESFQHPAIAKRAWDRAYAVFFCGGTIESAEVRINPDTIRDIRAGFPALSVLGSALYSSLLPGSVSIGFAWPVCQETVAAGLVERDVEVEVPPASELLTDTSLVRHIDRENADPDLSGVTPMPVTIETLATGIELQAQIEFQPMANEIERSCVAFGLLSLKHLGGKHGVGFGSVEIAYDTSDDPALYLGWLAENIDRQKAVILDLARQFVGKSVAPETLEDVGDA